MKRPTATSVCQIGILATTAVHAGAETHIARIWTHPDIAAVARGHLLGSLPRWSETGLRSTDVGFVGKWSYRSTIRSIGSIPLAARALVRIRRAHRATPFDAFYVHFKREQVLLTRSASRLAPVVWMEHGHFPTGRLRRPLVAAYRFAARRASAIICVSASVRDEIASVIGPSGPEIVVIENSIDPTWLTPPDDQQRSQARRNLGIRDEAALVVAVVAQLIPRKRVHLAIEAAADIEGCWLIICGAGPLDADLRAKAAGNQRVLFTGLVDDPRPVYTAADVLLLASSEEGFGQVLLEGACAGLPAVVVADCGFAERVSGWGYVADEPTGASVAHALRQAATIGPEAPRQWAEAHGATSWAAKHIAVLREVARHSSGQRSAAPDTRRGRRDARAG